MRVLVTGSGGYLGRAIADRLMQSGFEVVGVARKVPSGSRTESVAADIASDEDIDHLLETVAPCTAIVHAAACLDRGLYAPAVARTNCVGTQQMVRVMSSWKAEHFIFLSGVTVIGSPRDLPITEEHPVAPLTAYLASKVFGEHLMRLSAMQGFRTTSLRLTSPAGSGMSENRIFSVFVRNALEGSAIQVAGRGTRQQDYVDVRDVSSAVETCLEKSVSGVFNIASGRPVSNLDLANRVVVCLGSASEIRFLDTPDAEEGVVWYVSIEKAKQRFGFVPTFTLEESVRSLAESYGYRSV